MPELPEATDPGYDAAVVAQQSAADIAVSVLWALSGRQFGVCPMTLRPCEFGVRGLPTGGLGFTLARDGGHWVNYPCGCAGACTVSAPNIVHLPGPVHAVAQVVINGEVIDPAEYTVEGNALYRRAGRWPVQNLRRPLGDPGTWSVTYSRGQAVPAGVAKLTGLLAAEFHAACNGGKCRLPRNVTAVTRQGVNYQVYNPQEIYTSGKTGLAEVDGWLAAINPVALPQAPVVL